MAASILTLRTVESGHHSLPLMLPIISTFAPLSTLLELFHKKFFKLSFDPAVIDIKYSAH